MLSDTLLYSGSALVVLWGLAHIVKTRSVVAAFGPLSNDNRLVLTMEWIGEGLTLCFIGGLVSVINFGPGTETAAALLVYRASALMLIVMAVISAFTGARASLLPYKLCPWIFSGAALLFLLGSVV
jgi:hypothetical protein